MNCKQGDLAVIIKSKTAPFAVGHIVRCVESIVVFDTFAWVIEPKIKGFWCVHDSLLRPIRDNPGEDESLQWALVPGQKVAA